MPYESPENIICQIKTHCLKLKVQKDQGHKGSHLGIQLINQPREYKTSDVTDWAGDHRENNCIFETNQEHIIIPEQLGIVLPADPLRKLQHIEVSKAEENGDDDGKHGK